MRAILIGTLAAIAATLSGTSVGHASAQAAAPLYHCVIVGPVDVLGTEVVGAVQVCEPL
jgi:hypothetical protein